MSSFIARSRVICPKNMVHPKITSEKSLTLDTINPRIKVMEFAVRGPIALRANEIEKELQKGAKKPFTEVIKANIGDCQAMGQVPITFIRQVFALVTHPRLFLSDQFPEDIKARALEVLSACRGHTIGSYTDSTGLEIVRRRVAEYIEKRDGGVKSDWQNITMTVGATDAIKSVLKLLICNVNGKKSGVLLPIPQFPLYSATLVEYGINQHGYYLDEFRNWGLDIEELEKAYYEGSKTSHVRALVVINPGNPTGQVLTRENIEHIIKFAHEKQLFILADEVYQDNVYADGSQFHSVKKVMMEMGQPYSDMELASFMSSSKGYMGECGVRGGYVEMVNVCPQVKAMFQKSVSFVCPTVLGQIAMYCVAYPPKEGESSYTLYKKEKDDVLAALKTRAEMAEEAFNSFEGFSCNPVQGAMYAFPQFTLPQKAIDEAMKKGQAPDVFYAFELLENTGVCIVPGTGFGQKPGTYHFRTTILPEIELLKSMLDKFRKFHQEFIRKYK